MKIMHRLPDKNDNAYPPYDKVHLMVSKKANSSSELTIEVIGNVIFPDIGIHNNERGGVLFDDFKGHITYYVNKYVKSFKTNGDVDY